MTHLTAPDWQARGLWDGRISLIVVPLRPIEPWKDFHSEGGCQRSDWTIEPGEYTKDGLTFSPVVWAHSRFNESRFTKAPFAVGQHIWVRETWGWSVFASMPPSPQHRQFIRYKADGDFMSVPNWRSPVTMPRWASRMDLIVTDMRIGQVQSMTRTEADKAVGVPWRGAFVSVFGPDKWTANPWCCFASVTVERKGDHTNDQD